ncbi:hypothetical protein SOVF_214760, partial [Spinacia oleracea]
MKITPNTDLSALLSSKNPLQPQKAPDLPKKPLRKTPRKTSRNTPRLSKKSGPPTPLLRWKFHEERENGGGGGGGGVKDSNGYDGGNAVEEKSPECRRKSRREKVGPPVSARKLAATLWRMQLVVPENGSGNGGCGEGGGGGEQLKERRGKKESEDRLGFKVRFNSLFETQDLNLNLSKVGSFFVLPA